LLIGEFASGQTQDRRRFTWVKPHARDSRARSKMRNERFSLWPDDCRRLPLPLHDHNVHARIGQNPMSVYRAGTLDRLRPQAQNMLAQRHRR
jgi:hypothetical protein